MIAMPSIPAAALFVSDECRPSWNGRTYPSTFAFASAFRSVAGKSSELP
jgi:hypothetical protein